MSSTSNFVNRIFGKTNIAGLVNLAYSFEKKFKIVVFAPSEKAEEIILSMASGGAGHIGNYSVCSFRTEGTGTFKPGENTSPYSGKKGRLQITDEVRIEMICAADYLNDTIDKMYEVHPYETPAFEIYTIMTRDKKPDDKIVKFSLKKPAKFQTVIHRLNTTIDSVNFPAVGKFTNIKDVIVDFSGLKEISLPPGGKNKILYITKNSNSSINIQLI